MIQETQVRRINELISDSPYDFLISNSPRTKPVDQLTRLTVLGKYPYDELTYAEYKVMDRLPEGVEV